MTTDTDIVSADTVSNWECNRAMPDPEQVSRMERLYESPGLWDAFMRQQWPSYQERIPENPQIADACMAVINAGFQMGDVTAITEALSRCLMDRNKDTGLAKRYIKEAEEAAGALLSAAAKLKGG